MLPDRLKRGAAYIILVSYVTHLFAPIAHACESETPGASLWQGGRDPSPKREASFQRSLLTPLEQTTLGLQSSILTPDSRTGSEGLPIDEEKSRHQAEAYQYRLRVKTTDAGKNQFQVKLSRKEKERDASSQVASYKRLYTSTIQNGKLTSSCSETSEEQDDALLNLFKGAAVHKFRQGNETICFSWSMGDGAILKIARDGSVFFGQGSSVLLSAYDLVIKTSGELILQSLGVSKLTLQSPETRIIGSVVADHLHMDHTVTNEGGVQVNRLTGQGIFTNHAILNLAGTQESPAILGVREVINKKSKTLPKKATIGGSHLRITSENQNFYNGKDSEFTVGKTLIQEPSPIESTSFINKGSVRLHQATLNRQASNAGSWQAHQMTVNGHPFVNKSFGALNILDQLTITSELMNDGDLSVKNLLKLTKGANKGTIKGDNLVLDVDVSLVNHKNITAQAVTGTGHFTNHHTLNLKSSDQKPASIGVRYFYNNTDPNHKSQRPQVKGGKVFIEPTNAYFTNEKDGEIFVDWLGAKAYFPHSHKPSHNWFTNNGRIKTNDLSFYYSGHYLCQNWINMRNSGEIEANTLSISGGVRTNFTNTSTGILRIKDRVFLSSLANQGEVQANQIFLFRGNNSGKIYSALTLVVQEYIVNTGEITAQELSGAAFTNQGNLQLIGNEEASAKINVTRFENGAQDAPSPAKVKGSHIVVTSKNEQFLTHSNSQIETRNLLFEKPSSEGQSPVKPLEIKGTLNANVLDIYRAQTINTGSVFAIAFSVHGEKFVNASKALLYIGEKRPANNPDLSINSALTVGNLEEARAGSSSGHVPKSIQANVTSFQNDGEMVTEGTFNQQAGEFINTGRWEHTGNVDSGTTTLRNNKGTIVWENGKWDFVFKEFINLGNWSFDRMSCSERLTIHNHGALNFKNNAITFQQLINHKTLIFSGGQYAITVGLENNGLMSFLEQDWTFTEDAASTAPNRLVLKDDAVKGYVSPGDIESEKALIYDVQAFPKAIRSEGDVMFSPRHRQGRTVNDLLKVTTPGRVSFYAPATTTTQDYEFAIGHLALYIDGLFTTHHSFIAPEMTLDVNGPLTCGANNSVMGTIATTNGYRLVLMSDLPADKTPVKGKMYFEKSEGKLKYTVIAPDGKPVEGILDIQVDEELTPQILKQLEPQILEETLQRGHTQIVSGSLTVTAHSIDGRFGKFYGAGPTAITATKGNLLCGAPVQKGHDSSKRLGCGYEYNEKCGHKWVTTTVNDVNGAYVSSGSTLDLKAKSSLVLDYGRVFSSGNATFTALGKISAIRSILQGTGTARWTAPSSLFGCAPIQTLTVYLTPWYPNVPIQVAKSDRTEVHFADSIWFDTPDLTNQAAIISSRKSIYMLYNGQYVDLSEASKHPPTIKMQSYCGKSGSESRKIDFGFFSLDVLTGGVGPNTVFNFSPVIESGESIQIHMNDIVLTGTMNSPIITLQGKSALFHNMNRGRHTVVPTEALIIDLTYFAARSGFAQITSEGEIKTEFPFGKPHVLNPNHMVMLANDHGQPFPQSPLNYQTIFNPLRSLSSNFLDLSIQSALSELIGKVYFNEEHGNSLMKTALVNTAKFRQRTGKDHVKREDIKAPMALYGLQQTGNGLHKLITYIGVPPSEFNPYQASGDISGNKITITTQDDQTHLNNRIVARDLLNVTSTEGSVIRRTEAYTVSHEEGERKVTQQIAMPQQQFICTEGDVDVFAHKDIPCVGTYTQAGRDVFETAETGNITKLPLILQQTVEINREEDDGLLSTKTTSETSVSHTMLPTGTVAGRNIEETAGKRIHLSGAKEIAGESLKYQAQSLATEAAIAINTDSKTSTTSSIASERTESSSSSTLCVEPTELNAKRIILNLDSAAFKGTDFVAMILEDNTKDGASFGPTIATLEYFHQMVSKSALSRSDVGCQGWYEVMQPCRLAVNQIVRQINDGEIKFNSVLWDKDRTQIIGKFAETTYQLKKWHTEWAIHEQVIPDAVLVVVSLAIAFATQGMGAALGESLFGAGTIGAEMAAAGFVGAFTQLGTSVLRDGDPLKAVKSLCSGQGLRSLGTSVATAGLIGNAPTGLQEFAQRLMVNGLRSVVRASVSSVIEKRNFGDALKDGAVDALVSSISASITEKIGEAASAKANPLTPIEHKLAHFAVGAGMGAVLDRDNPLAGGITGGAGAVIGEVVAESLADREQLMREAKLEAQREGRPDEASNIYRAKLNPYVNIARLVAGSVIAATGRDPSIAIAAATNALENNFAKTIPLSDVAQVSDANLKDEKTEDEEDPKIAKKPLKAKEKTKGKGKEKATTRLKDDFADDAGESYLKVSGLQDEFLHDSMNHPQRLYFEMAEEKAEAPEPQNYLRDQEKYFDEAIEAVNKDLKNPHLAFFEKVSLRNYRDTLRETQHQVKGVRTITNWAGEEIPYLKRISATNGRHIQNQIDQNLKV